MVMCGEPEVVPTRQCLAVKANRSDGAEVDGRTAVQTLHLCRPDDVTCFLCR